MADKDQGTPVDYRGRPGNDGMWRLRRIRREARR
jgi:hypothetical protein